MDQVLKSWAIGTDPAVHIGKIYELFQSGVTIVNVHSGQPDQARVIDFYAEHVLPVMAAAAKRRCNPEVDFQACLPA